MKRTVLISLICLCGIASSAVLKEFDGNDDYDEYLSVEEMKLFGQFNSLQNLENVGIDTREIDPDIMEDAILTAPKLIKKYGYPVETYNVTTSDGYILELHRIPGSPTSPPAPGKRVAFLMHGLLDSSSTWVVMGPKIGFGYMLADLGYDVWMGNARGNRYSRNHKTLNPDKKKFWQFSWHEIGTIDLPALIDFVLGETKQEQLHYIGHSQGTTAFFVMGSEVPKYNAKIMSMQALAPVAYMGHVRSPFVRAMVLFLNTIDIATSILGVNEFLPNNDLLQLGGMALCRDEAVTQFICSNTLFLMAGYNTDQLNTTMLPVIMGHTPAGASTKQMIHYGQEVRSNKFRQYDFGILSNMKQYGSTSPPKYDLKKVTAPVALHYSSNDWLSEPVDVEKLRKELGNVLGWFLVPLPKFNHLDFLWAVDVRKLLYERVIKIMQITERE